MAQPTEVAETEVEERSNLSQWAITRPYMGSRVLLDDLKGFCDGKPILIGNEEYTVLRVHQVTPLTFEGSISDVLILLDVEPAYSDDDCCELLDDDFEDEDDECGDECCGGGCDECGGCRQPVLLDPDMAYTIVEKTGELSGTLHTHSQKEWLAFKKDSVDLKRLQAAADVAIKSRPAVLGRTIQEYRLVQVLEEIAASE